MTVSSTTLELATLENEPVTVARADVWELRVPRPSKAKTGALVGAIAGAIVLGMFINDTGAEIEF